MYHLLTLLTALYATLSTVLYSTKHNVCLFSGIGTKFNLVIDFFIPFYFSKLHFTKLRLYSLPNITLLFRSFVNTSSFPSGNCDVICILDVIKSIKIQIIFYVF